MGLMPTTLDLGQGLLATMHKVELFEPLPLEPWALRSISPIDRDVDNPMPLATPLMSNSSISPLAGTHSLYSLQVF